MVLKVCFVHGIESIVVEHGVHFRVVGVVGGANCVHVVLLHEYHVLKHFFRRYGAAVYRRGIVAVYALEEYFAAIYIYLRTGKLYVAETIFRRECHFLVSFAVSLYDMDSVEVGRFGRPRLYLRDVHREVCLSYTSRKHRAY